MGEEMNTEKKKKEGENGLVHRCGWSQIIWCVKSTLRE